MKKAVVLIISLTALMLCLAACGNSKKENADTTYAPGQVVYVNDDTTATQKEYDVTPGVSDYDEEGKLILTSTDNRYVYVKETGYIVFSFNEKTDTCFQVLDVKSFDSEEAALEYLSQNVTEQMSSGNYTNVVQNGKYVVFTASIDHPAYGEYLKSDRSTVERIFPDELKQ